MNRYLYTLEFIALLISSSIASEVWAEPSASIGLGPRWDTAAGFHMDIKGGMRLLATDVPITFHPLLGYHMNTNESDVEHALGLGGYISYFDDETMFSIGFGAETLRDAIGEEDPGFRTSVRLGLLHFVSGELAYQNYHGREIQILVNVDFFGFWQVDY